MLFNSLEFLTFFPLIVVLFALTRGFTRTIVLLFASYYFYMSWNPYYLILIVISTLIDYFAAIEIEKSISKRRKKIFLALSLTSNLSILFFFKYFSFFSQIVHDLSGSSQTISGLSVLLPVGISFYTFQTMSYSIDIYRNKIRAERNIFRFALYVSFFPQLVAGPIERASHILPQLKNGFSTQISYNNLIMGLRYILLGYFQKLVLADRLAIFSDFVFDQPGLFFGLTLWLALLFFCFQIYFDFLSYSNIAIGLARIFGIEIMENFSRPYLSRTIAEFWKRWHISLSTWFRDYVYIPMGGSHTSRSSHAINLLGVFLISGLWHGAGYNYIIWGLLHGLFLILFTFSQSIREKYLSPNKYIATVITFIFVLLAWVPFRITGVYDIGETYLNLFRFDPAKQLRWIFLEGRGLNLALIVGYMCIERHLGDSPIPVAINRFTSRQRWSIYYIIIALIFYLGEFNRTPFIYFQF